MRKDPEFIAMLAAVLTGGTTVSPKEAVDRAEKLLQEVDRRYPEKREAD